MAGFRQISIQMTVSPEVYDKVVKPMRARKEFAPFLSHILSAYAEDQRVERYLDKLVFLRKEKLQKMLDDLLNNTGPNRSATSDETDRAWVNSGQSERMVLEQEKHAVNMAQPVLNPESESRKLELEIRKLELELEIEKAKAGVQKVAPESQVKPVEAPEVEPRTNAEGTEAKPVAQKPEPEIIEAETTAEESAPVSKAKNSTTVHPTVSAEDIYEIPDDDDFDYEAFEA